MGKEGKLGHMDVHFQGTGRKGIWNVPFSVG